MIFEDVAREAVDRVYGAMASVIMGRDGIPLSMYKKEGVEMELESLGIEYANVLSEVNRASGTIGSGTLNELAISTDKYVVLLRTVNPEYFMCVIMAPDGNFGKARFLMRISIPKLKAEL
jgi:predicted regulator of Ras-like GTPase activity (Roadblock/LC7/MglB family)